MTESLFSSSTIAQVSRPAYRIVPGYKRPASTTHPGKKCLVYTVKQVLQIEVSPHHIRFIIDLLLLVPAEDNAAGPDHLILELHRGTVQHPHIAGDMGGEEVFYLPGNLHLLFKESIGFHRPLQKERYIDILVGMITGKRSSVSVLPVGSFRLIGFMNVGMCR